MYAFTYALAYQHIAISEESISQLNKQRGLIIILGPSDFLESIPTSVVNPVQLTTTDIDISGGSRGGRGGGGHGGNSPPPLHMFFYIIH